MSPTAASRCRFRPPGDAGQTRRDSVDDFLADNPHFEPYRQVFTSGLIKLIAFDPDVAAGFATNVNVIVHNLGTSMSLSQYADATKAQIAA